MQICRNLPQGKAARVLHAAPIETASSWSSGSSGASAYLSIQQLEQLVIYKQQAFQFRMGHWLQMQPVNDVVTQPLALVLHVRGQSLWLAVVVSFAALLASNAAHVQEQIWATCSSQGQRQEHWSRPRGLDSLFGLKADVWCCMWSKMLRLPLGCAICFGR